MKSILATLVGLLSLPVLADVQTWSVAPKPRGFVRFTVEGPLDDVVGETRSLSGTLSFTTDSWATGKGVVAVDLNTLRTGIDQRDDDMRTEFLEVKRFPYAILSIDSITQPSAPALKVGAAGEGQATGSFELHGVRRAVKFPIKVKLESETRLVASGRLDLPFADFNISRPQRLFLKLGDTAEVSFEIAFVQRVEAKSADPKVAAAAPAPEAVPQPTVAQVLPQAPKPKPKPARKAKPALVFTYQFKGDEPKARGEKLFHLPETGGAGNKMTCFHCHAKSDERDGIALKDGHVRAANTLYNAGQRPKFWGGFTTSSGAAASICQKQFMKGTGLTEAQEADVVAFIDAISPDAAPELDYRTNYRSMETLLRDPTAGDAAKGKTLADKYCMTCHLDGRVGPVWAPGLYEPDWVVRRVRRLEGHQNKQMPAWTIARLPDSDLRDIVTYLTSNPSAPPLFNRKKASGGAGGQR